MNANASRQRRLARIVTTPHPAPGFGGPGHEAVYVLSPDRFVDQDPFILLADDRLDMPPGARVGGEHPHAGFEIATLALEGGIDEGEEGALHEGDVLWTTTGSGIIHGKSAVPTGPTRILQLWFALPEADRWVDPHFEVIRRDEAAVRSEPGALARMYSGSVGEARVRRREQTPITMVDIALDAGASFDQELPAGYNGFLYLLEGDVRVGEERLGRGQVGWLDRPEAGPVGNDSDDRPGAEASTLLLVAGDSGARAILYAGLPQGYPILSRWRNGSTFP